MATHYRNRTTPEKVPHYRNRTTVFPVPRPPLSACVSRHRLRYPVSDQSVERWERLLAENDDIKVWRAINWNGVLSEDHTLVTESPSDNEFKEHFDEILNSSDTVSDDYEHLRSDVYIPVLDDPITPQEVSDQIKRLKGNKACGPDGIPPGVLKLLPDAWIVYITTVFNCIFMAGSFPSSWATAKLFTVFKGGSRSLVTNYRGISVVNSMVKLYDMVLCDRLNRWFKPFREQAGSQTGRGCLEHVVSLRLLMQVATKKKLRLYITFVDFAKAYDRVRRNMLFSILKRLGCGMIMLFAIIAMYRVTHSAIGTALITASIGVRQGAPSSCLLFVLYVNDLIRLIKQNCGVDGFLQWLHVLVLMDDTVILPTSRAGMIQKITLLNKFCVSHGMDLNVRKTKFMVLNAEEDDKQPLIVDGVIVEHCSQYVYLGSPFTCDGSTSSAIKVHAHRVTCHVLKFIEFLSKNNDMSFYVKKRVFNCALLSSIMYGCESWLNGDIKPVKKLYMWCIKRLLLFISAAGERSFSQISPQRIFGSV